MSHLPPAEPDRGILSGAIITLPDADEVLEGEIIETQSEVSLEQSPLNLAANLSPDSQQQREALASWLLLQEEAIFGTDYLSPCKNWLTFFVTPCRFSALGVLLLANFLLAWSQLSTVKPGTSPQTAQLSAPVFQPQTREIPLGLNLAAEKSALALSSLSTATPASPPVSRATVPQTAPLGTAATPSLSHALVPYYFPAQPAQGLQSSPIAQVTTAPPATAPTIQYLPVPAPVLPSVQQPPLPRDLGKQSVQQPPTPQDLGKQSIIRQDLDRLRLERENQPPLGFNQEYRIKMQSHQTQTDPKQLRQQLQQLQQQATPTKLE